MRHCTNHQVCHCTDDVTPRKALVNQMMLAALLDDEKIGARIRSQQVTVWCSSLSSSHAHLATYQMQPVIIRCLPFAIGSGLFNGW
jgi:hypothetical protein